MNNYYLSLVCTLAILSAFFSLSLQFKHLLSILLSLEAIAMNMFIFMYSTAAVAGWSSFFSLVLVALSACEASLGLSILVSMIRNKGNDYVSSFSSQKC